jgi:tetratricopeptide (TPR) repeat protein
VAHSRVGGVLQAQGKLEAAQAAFAEYLAINRRLVEQDPSNADWQRGLGLACLRIARLDAKIGRNDVALPLYEESYRIFAVLVEQAPGFVQWAEDKKIIEVELALCRSQLSHSKDKDWLSWIQRLLRFSSR